MRIAGLEIEKFGIWERLSLPKLSRGLNIFYGPNEAGKTTLLQFIRSSLYGCTNDNRSRYIQMVISENDPDKKSSFLAEDGKAEKKEDLKDPENNVWIGGALSISTEYGQYRLDRRYLRRSSSVYNKQTALEQKSGFVLTNGLAGWSGRFYPIAGKGIAESLIVTGPDGTRLSDYFVQTLVNNIDEATFNNVFAIGLDELQKLGTLSETDAAQMLYRLSVGVDRVSLIQVLHQIVDERNEIFDIQGKSTILEGLLAQKNRIGQKISEATFNLNEYNRILGEQRDVLETAGRLKEKIDKLHHQQRLYEIALAVAPIWDSRSKFRSEIAEMGNVLAIEEDSLTESKKYQEAITATTKNLANLRSEYTELKKELDQIEIAPHYLEMAPRIEWLVEEIPHLDEIQKKRILLTSEKDEINQQLSQEELRLRGAKNGKIYLTRNVVDTLQEKKSDVGLTPAEKAASDQNSALWTDSDLREVEDYRIPARAIHRIGMKYRKTKEQFQQTKKRLDQVTEKLETGLTSRGQRNLSEALENTNELVIALKRRIEIGKRLNEMNTYRKELERVNANLVANQSLPTIPLIMIGAGIVAGGLLIGMAFFRKDLGLGILGALLGTICFAVKGSIEHRNFARLQENQRQLGLLLKQIEQAKSEAQVIDTKFPAPTQAFEVRLQKAQSDLSWFEKLTPVDTQWKQINQHVKTLENRSAKCKEQLGKALKRWRRWLKIAGLPLSLKPIQIKEMLERVDIAEDLKRRVEAINSELEFLDREQKGIEDHLTRVVAETLYKYPESARQEEIILGLEQELKNVRALVAKQEDLNKRRILYLRQRRKVIGDLHRQKKELRDYLSLFNVHEPQALIDLRQKWLDFQKKKEQLELLELQLEEGIGRFCDEKAISDLLDNAEIRAEIPEDQINLEERIENLTTEHQEKLELSGRLGEQLNVLANKKDSIKQQFDRSALDVRINEVSTLWQSRATACRMMEDIRKAYERERQPETLREASNFLRKLTSGQYVKIWTPLGENLLYVDTAQGKTLDVSDLSRGTREQLFIAIRLALTITFEKHGVQLPLILDDVLVNFDNKRARAAAKLLHSFAKAGHQILLFTCHDHICKIFLELETPVHVLPASDDKNKKFKILLPPSKIVKEPGPQPLPVSSPPVTKPAPAPIQEESVKLTKFVVDPVPELIPPVDDSNKPIIIEPVQSDFKSSKISVSVFPKKNNSEMVESVNESGNFQVLHIARKKDDYYQTEKRLDCRRYEAVKENARQAVPYFEPDNSDQQTPSVIVKEKNSETASNKTVITRRTAPIERKTETSRKSAKTNANEIKKIDTHVVDQTREVLNRIYSSRDDNPAVLAPINVTSNISDNDLLNSSEEDSDNMKNEVKPEETEHIDVKEMFRDFVSGPSSRYSVNPTHVVSDSSLLTESESSNGIDLLEPVMSKKSNRTKQSGMEVIDYGSVKSKTGFSGNSSGKTDQLTNFNGDSFRNSQKDSPENASEESSGLNGDDDEGESSSQIRNEFLKAYFSEDAPEDVLNTNTDEKSDRLQSLTAQFEALSSSNSDNDDYLDGKDFEDDDSEDDDSEDDDSEDDDSEDDDSEDDDSEDDDSEDDDSEDDDSEDDDSEDDDSEDDDSEDDDSEDDDSEDDDSEDDDSEDDDSEDDDSEDDDSEDDDSEDDDSEDDDSEDDDSEDDDSEDDDSEDDDSEDDDSEDDDSEDDDSEDDGR